MELKIQADLSMVHQCASGWIFLNVGFNRVTSREPRGQTIGIDYEIMGIFQQRYVMSHRNFDNINVLNRLARFPISQFLAASRLKFWEVLIPITS
jgi:hypothetical protein